MAAVSLTSGEAIAAALPAQRARLVRLCARLAGDPTVAEDLAQETLLEAWRHASKLTDSSGADRWLNAIARNVCLRWRRVRGRDLAWLIPFDAPDTSPHEHDMIANLAAAEDDLTLELERDDLARLLDRAMAALPPETRQVLVARCIEETPQAEAAARLGLTEGALAVRLHRGKLALRRILETELRDDAANYGIPLAEADGWQETRMWCMFCGQHRLRGYFNAAAGELILRCPTCEAARGVNTCHHVSHRGLFHGVTAHKVAFNRVMRWAGPYYRAALRDGHAICQHCWRPAPLRMGHPAGMPLSDGEQRGFHVVCARCDYPQNNGSLSFLILALPDGRRFWREHPRLRTLPEREIEAGGFPAVVAGYESVTDGARLEVVATRSNLSILSTHVTPHP